MQSKPKDELATAFSKQLTAITQTPPMRAIQFPVHNVEYPRNKRIREYLEANGWECQPIVRGGGLKTTAREKITAFRKLLALSKRADVIILSEMSLKYAPLTWLISRVRGTVHVVDGFIGLHETEIEDKKRAREGSLKSRVLRFQDNLAIRLADLYLVDTLIRSENIASTVPKARNSILSLPVGAPDWAQYKEYVRSADSPEVLYYGNYIPLHGLENYVWAVSKMAPYDRPVTKMVGDGDCYANIRELVERLELSESFIFHPPVPERELAKMIDDSKVVVGIFGSSNKAATVIANKVWQGLAGGRRVITRSSPALDEISSICGELLLQVPAGDPTALGFALQKALQTDLPGNGRQMADLLEEYVDGQFAALLNYIEDSVGASKSVARKSS